MDKYKITKDNVNAFVRNLKKEYVVFGPKKKEEQFSFEQIYNEKELDLDYNTSILPPIKIFLPNNELLLVSDLKTYESKAIFEEESKVLIGVHPCDIHAIQVMDKILANEPRDENYFARRRQSVIIGLQCISSCTDKTLCYDKSTLFVDSGYDIMMWKKDNTEYLVEPISDIGLSIVQDNNVLFHKIDDKDFNDFNNDFKKSQNKNFKKRLHGNVEDLPEALKSTYNSKLWHEVGSKCFSCSACTIVCPTCYCFDVYDEVDIDLNEAKRYRKWDSCENCAFALISGNENLREHEYERNRHRVFKKEVYPMKNFNLSSCVGCGRCNTTCVAGISLIDIYNKALTKEII